MKEQNKLYQFKKGLKKEKHKLRKKIGKVEQVEDTKLNGKKKKNLNISINNKSCSKNGICWTRFIKNIQLYAI